MSNMANMFQKPLLKNEIVHWQALFCLPPDQVNNTFKTLALLSQMFKVN